MRCVVTAGPTFEPLDQVRRLTNFSTGRLGVELADALAGDGHDVSLLLGEAATCPAPATRPSLEIRRFTSGADLAAQLESLGPRTAGAVFHLAAVSDFKPGKIWTRDSEGRLTEISAGKLSSSHAGLLVELVPCPKIISSLRSWFPAAKLVGWKFEVEGSREAALAKAAEQVAGNRTDACVLNGPVIGSRFIAVRREGKPVELAGRAELLEYLKKLAKGG